MAIGIQFKASLLSGLLLIAVLPEIPAATITFDTDNRTRDGFPFGVRDAGATYTGEYQQIYYNFTFRDPAFITQIAFSSYKSSGPDPFVFEMEISLGVTARSAASPGSGFEENLITVFSNVLSANITSDGSDYDLIINLETPYFYDPADGNLMLGVRVSSASGPGNLEFRGGGTKGSSRIWREGDAVVAKPYQGLTTRFTTAPVPEPSGFALGWGGTLFAFLCRRKKWGVCSRHAGISR